MPDAHRHTKHAAAHVNVVQGDAPRRVTFATGIPARVLVGSAPDADLRIARSDVAPRQLECVWDGRGLWVQDALRLGRTFVNGRPLNEWAPVSHHAWISFGGVRLWLRGPDLPADQRTPDFAALEQASVARELETASCRRHETGRITIPPELLARLNEAGGP
jgi:hypothetical protein